MDWQHIFFHLNQVFSDPYLKAVEDDLAAWLLPKLIADKKANLNDLVNEFRKTHDLWTHAEHCEHLEKKTKFAMALKAQGMEKDAIEQAVRAQFGDD